MFLTLIVLLFVIPTYHGEQPVPAGDPATSITITSPRSRLQQWPYPTGFV